jgi:hypothetical protein
MAPKLVQVRGSYTRYFVIVYVYYNWGSYEEKWRKILINKPELRIEVKSPGVGQCPASKFFRQKNICMKGVVGSQYGAMTVAADRLGAQLHSQCKLTTPRHENRKIRHETELLKAKEPAPDV